MKNGFFPFSVSFGFAEAILHSSFYILHYLFRHPINLLHVILVQCFEATDA